MFVHYYEFGCETLSLQRPSYLQEQLFLPLESEILAFFDNFQQVEIPFSELILYLKVRNQLPEANGA